MYYGTTKKNLINIILTTQLSIRLHKLNSNSIGTKEVLT